MMLTVPQRPTVLGLALAGVAAFAVGGTVTARAITAPAQRPAPAVVAQDHPGVHPVRGASATAAGTPQPAATDTREPSRRVTLSQAVALAAGRTHARVEKVEVKKDRRGVVYEVELLSARGDDVKVFVLGRTGQVVSADADSVGADLPEAQGPDDPDLEDGD
jgi:hypothetical protein